MTSFVPLKQQESDEENNDDVQHTSVCVVDHHHGQDLDTSKEEDPLHDYLVPPSTSSKSYNGISQTIYFEEEDNDGGTVFEKGSLSQGQESQSQPHHLKFQKSNLPKQKYRKMRMDREQEIQFRPNQIVSFKNLLSILGPIILLCMFGLVAYGKLNHDNINLIDFGDGDTIMEEIDSSSESFIAQSSFPMSPTTDRNSSTAGDVFHVTNSTWYGGISSEPPHYPTIAFNLVYGPDDHNENVGYIQYPNIFNNTLVFCSEGDVYLTRLEDTATSTTTATTTTPNGDPNASRGTPLIAMRLTSTVGNVGHPTINPKYPYLLAYTATYTGHREVYLMDLRSNHRSQPSRRLTYMSTESGVLSISGWEDDGTTLIVSSFNLEVAMEDVRLYKIGVLVDPQSGDISVPSQKHPEVQRRMTSIGAVSSISAIKLSQAIDSVVDEESNCRYFTRYKQSSNTVRYMGGTTEHLWVYCDGEQEALSLTNDYKGTSKSPRMYKMVDGQKFLFFMSDRADVNGKEWKPTTMNLWATPLPTRQMLYNDNVTLQRPFAITSVSCQFQGMHLQEYNVDVVTGNVILRIGADVFLLDSEIIKSKILRRMSDNNNNISSIPLHVPIAVYSDFSNLQERTIPISNPVDITTNDFFDSGYGTISALMTARGQVFVNPVVPDTSTVQPYGGSGMNMPARRYRVSPGSTIGGSIRVLGSWFLNADTTVSAKSILVLATDPLSATAELAFYIVDASSGASSAFENFDNLPKPLIGGHVNGGSVKDGGLGSIKIESVAVSPCGRRFAWADTDGNIRVMQISQREVFTLPKHNEMGEPMIGTDTALSFSPVGRYLAIEHSAKNHFRIISISDLNDPNQGRITLGRVVQATPSRFNSMKPVWGKAPVDFKVEKIRQGSVQSYAATTIYFLTDRDIVLTGNYAPWGSRAPEPFFRKASSIYALPLLNKNDEMAQNPYEEIYGGGSFIGGGALELFSEHLNAWSIHMMSNTTSTSASTRNKESDNMPSKSTDVISAFDYNISFAKGSDNMDFARRAYHVADVPESNYIFLHQLQDDASLIVAESVGPNIVIKAFAMAEFPDNGVTPIIIDSTSLSLQDIGVSTNRNFIYFTYSGKTKVIKNTADDFMSTFVSDITTSKGLFTKNIVDTNQWAVRVIPKLEYFQMYSDAWRMLRDYYYDQDMGGVDWSSVHSRFLSLVHRCGRREELDDILKQMSAELSALHVFVYGGEYDDPLHGNQSVRSLNSIASLGANLERSDEFSGYVITEIPIPDPDFNSIDGNHIYSPLSDTTLRLSGQRGLLPGDVILGVNGENVMNVADIHMLLRGLAGRSVRLEVIRLKSKSSFSFDPDRKLDISEASSEPVIVVPISSLAAKNLRYAAWEWKTRESAEALAAKNGFTVGYIHLRSMSGAEAEDAFARGFFPDFDKDAMIIDVRHNLGGNIDSWLLSALQKKAWMYFQGRATNITSGGLGWDEQYAFRGHLVVLIDEKTSSDGEGFARGVSELGLGKLVGTRTWGGGIWLSSDNKLVDQGIASAPEYGTYNDKFGWGLGIEQVGVEPDVEVDNNPRLTFDGFDQQLETAIAVLKQWLDDDPIALPKNPGMHRNMSLDRISEACNV